MKNLFFAGVMGLALAGLSGPPAHAGGFTVTLTQQGSNVVASGSGAIDLSGMSLFASPVATPCVNFADMSPSAGILDVGGGSSFAIGGTCPPTNELFGDWYDASASGPGAFGTGGYHGTNVGNSGDIVGFASHQCLLASCSNSELVATLLVPQGYVSGDPLADSSTWENSTFASLGVTPGTYTWTWGTGAGQSYTIDVVASTPTGVPEPSSLALFGVGLLGLWVLRRRTAS